MFIFENLNPHSNRVGDCVVRAISKASGKCWQEIYIELAIDGYILGDIMNANAVWDYYLRKNGYKRIMISDGDDYTLSEFAKKHPVGCFVVGTGTHATAVVDGDIYDVWDCSEETPLYFYDLTRY